MHRLIHNWFESVAETAVPRASFYQPTTHISCLFLSRYQPVLRQPGDESYFSASAHSLRCVRVPSRCSTGAIQLSINSLNIPTVTVISDVVLRLSRKQTWLCIFIRANASKTTVYSCTWWVWGCLGYVCQNLACVWLHVLRVRTYICMCVCMCACSCECKNISKIKRSASLVVVRQMVRNVWLVCLTPCELLLPVFLYGPNSTRYTASLNFFIN